MGKKRENHVCKKKNTNKISICLTSKQKIVIGKLQMIKLDFIVEEHDNNIFFYQACVGYYYYCTQNSTFIFSRILYRFNHRYILLLSIGCYSQVYMHKILHYLIQIHICMTTEGLLLSNCKLFINSCNLF